MKVDVDAVHKRICHFLAIIRTSSDVPAFTSIEEGAMFDQERKNQQLVQYVIERTSLYGLRPTERLVKRLTKAAVSVHLYSRTTRPLFIPSILGGGNFLPAPQKTYNSPSNGCQIVCSKSFFHRDSELQIYHGNFLLMDNKLRKLFVIKQSKWRKFMPKMQQYTFGGRAQPGPAGEVYALPQTRIAAMGAYTSNGSEARGWGLLIRRGREGRR